MKLMLSGWRALLLGALWIIGSSVVWAGGVLPDEAPVLLNPAEAAQVAVILKPQWSAARSEIHSAALKYRSSSGSFLKPFEPWDRMFPLVQEYDVKARPENMAELTTYLNQNSPPFRKERFHPCELYLEGQRLLTHHPTTGLLQAVDSRHHYFFNKQNDEILLLGRGQSSLGVERPQSMRPVPDPSGIDLAESIWRYQEAGLLRINYGAGSGENRSFDLVYESNGMPYFTRVWNPHENEPTVDLWLLNYVRFPGEIDFPTASIKFQYRQGMLTSYRLYLIDEAEFNAPIRPSALAFGAPKNVHIRDERVKHQVNTVALSEDVADVAYFVEHVLDLGHPQSVEAGAVSGSPPASSHRFMLWINGLALGAVGFFLWNWHSPRKTGADRHELGRLP